MAIGTARRQFGQFLGGKTVSGPTEVQLLDRFVSGGDDAAFTALVARHGPMVRAVCRRLLDEELTRQPTGTEPGNGQANGRGRRGA